MEPRHQRSIVDGSSIEREHADNCRENNQLGKQKEPASSPWVHFHV